ncbi:transglutaminase-like cysteine peptidase [Halochromatium roseum]|uniref:transglutaminase-like cysteine peptidase n=1 Tax=Halochromatium roseum TaxID=391920 RepID=UPI001A917A52|nr:transglutaminase-like cysteine peptidase [Halochromatium roseum]MBK5940067.1 hypothetical protein [Halochromatium roseum]
MKRTPSRRERRLVVLLTVQLSFSSLLLANTAAAEHFESAGIFGESGKQFTNFRPIPKWQDVLKRFRIEQRRQRDCDSGGCRDDHDWMQTLDRLRGKDRAVQVREVNRFANNWRYITDPTNWNQDDYWSTPDEFLKKHGDCEDYAIIKFLSLRALGFSNDDLRLVVIKDLNLGVAHSVTLVRLNDRIMMLDNQIDRVIPANAVKHYKPIFAANEEAWWLFTLLQ